LDALAQRAPLVLLLDDLQWADGASLDLLRYLGHSWREHGSRVLLLGTLRREGLELNPQLADLSRDLPVSQVPLQPLSQAETLQFLEALVGERAPGTRSEGKPGVHIPARPSTTGPGAVPAPERETPLVALSDFLFARTGGQPLYLLETLKLLREREWLVPRLGADGVFRLELAVEMATIVAQERSQRELLPPSVRALILTRLEKLSPAARQLVRAIAVLGTQATAARLWRVAQVEVQAGVEALEEAVRSGILREEAAGRGRPASYGFAYELMRDVVYTELGEARRLVLHQQALALLQNEGTPGAELVYHVRASGEAEAADRYSVQAGVAVDGVTGHYKQARTLTPRRPAVATMLEASEIQRL
jgi:predicted ATPase